MLLWFLDVWDNYEFFDGQARVQLIHLCFFQKNKNKRKSLVLGEGSIDQFKRARGS